MGPGVSGSLPDLPDSTQSGLVCSMPVGGIIPVVAGVKWGQLNTKRSFSLYDLEPNSVGPEGGQVARFRLPAGLATGHEDLARSSNWPCVRLCANESIFGSSLIHLGHASEAGAALSEEQVSLRSGGCHGPPFFHFSLPQSPSRLALSSINRACVMINRDVKKRHHERTEDGFQPRSAMHLMTACLSTSRYVERFLCPPRFV
jgi:hypothetical protein